MTKSELVARMAIKYPHLKQHEVKRMVERLFDELARSLEQGRRVELRGFGSFSIRRRDPRRGRNPKTGATVNVEEKFVLFFKAGKKLRQIVDA